MLQVHPVDLYIPEAYDGPHLEATATAAETEAAAAVAVAEAVAETVE